MGIKGLHGLLKSIQKPCHLKKFSGQTLGVDAYGWLHRGTVACAVDLVLGRPTRKHIDFVLNRVRMLLFFGVTPYLVFDGDELPSKAGTEIERQQRRQQSKALGLELQRKGRMAEAYQELQKAVDVTPLMARELIEELKKMNVQYVVAPYEADSQMVYLEQQGIVSGIISEDSDLLVFGAKRLLSKLDQHGDCIEINRADFTACRDISLIGWTDDDFRRMCILSGCDYLPNIPRMGLKTAYRSIRKYKSVERTLRMLQLEGQYNVPTDYLDNFRQAELTFLYQWVFCPKAGKLVTLTVPESGVNVKDLTFIGADMDPEVAVGVARGDLDPMTKEPLILKPPVALDKRLTNTISRRQTLGSSAELKSSKPIGSFFTPKRVPLAELDPNSLSPSPSQQRLLHRHANSSWEGVSAPSRPGVARSASSVDPSRRLSSPLVRSVERNSFLAQASRMSNLQPAKRQRLCSDADEATEPSLPDCRSRFFASPLDDSSPSGQKAARTKKARKSTLDVLSDDSTEDLMSQIPDPVQAGTKDEHHNSGGNSVVPRADATPVPKHDTQDRPGQSLGKSNTLETTHTSATPSSTSDVLDEPVEKRKPALLSKFAFKAGKVFTSPGKGGSGDKDLQPNTPNEPLQTSPGVGYGAFRSPPRRQRTTPLQRLGQSALSRSRSFHCVSPSLTGFVTPKGPIGRLMGGKRAVDPVKNGPTPSQGSEDMIIPDSEDDEEPEGSKVSSGEGRASFDIRRFSFTGK
ncbi:PIN domain-like protein [Aspergillus heteromorphus CBS 117.55]|uniref:PIN domain-like protein n=1 Tax=Aspergillus heteromorphus CBS 117.55 TaxID=1448321 RepID=A0A317X4X1_9EURO|nr:PIN domain-like protein [Aspergillus heteromorphus CBS 117.55]PWY92652.1 PIN domain-like protein [Aspergillus heteromorphus CBS 117.55]